MTTAAKPRIGARPRLKNIGMPSNGNPSNDRCYDCRCALRRAVREGRSSNKIAGRAAGSPLGVFVRLEPYAGKLARTVLREGWTSNGSSLPGE